MLMRVLGLNANERSGLKKVLMRGLGLNAHEGSGFKGS